MNLLSKRAFRRLLGIGRQVALFAPQFLALQKAGGQSRFRLRWCDAKACLSDATATTGFDRQYVFHTAWAARILARTKPAEHVDLSSSLFFIGCMSAFVPITFLDYRPAGLGLSDVKEQAGDIHHLPFKDGSIASLSSMHVVEHIGLGRYGEPLDYNGDLKACEELKRVLALDGQLLFVVPLGAEPMIMFNAHRIYTKAQVTGIFSGFALEEFCLIPENPADGSLVPSPGDELLSRQRYGCGCFLFRKPLAETP